jgi:asparagine N-glycosylation enzyme membrane subunit Stt3
MSLRLQKILTLTLLSVITFASRVVGQLDKVFINGLFPLGGSEAVLFRGQDAWYHIRLASYLRENWPVFLHNDWFANPLGQPPVGWPPVTTYLIGLPFLSEHAMEVWAAFLPPLVAIGIVITTYYLAMEIFHSRGYSLIAALLVAVLPTEVFHRTMLGFTDHHMLEVLFTSLTLLFMFRMHKSVKWCIPTGISLGLLFLTWTGAAFVYLVLAGGAFAETLIHPGSKLRWMSVSSAIAPIMFLPFAVTYSYSPLPNLLSLAAGTMLFWLVGESQSSSLPRRWQLLILGTALVVGTTIACYKLPVLDYLLSIFGYGDSSVISEMSPATFSTFFSHYGLALFLAVGALILYAVKEKEIILPLTFLIMFVAMVAHVRYGYYLTVPLCLLAAYGIRWLASLFNQRTAVAIVLTVFTLMLSFANIFRLATYENDITPDMYNAMTTLREISESPYDSSNAYYEKLSTNADYLVLTLWDYNHWIIHIARRAPVTNAYGYEYGNIMQFFIDGRDPAPYIEKLYEEPKEVRYLVVDSNMLESNWLKWATGSPEHPFLDSLWEGKAPDWTLITVSGDVRIYERMRKGNETDSN